MDQKLKVPDEDILKQYECVKDFSSDLVDELSKLKLVQMIGTDREDLTQDAIAHYAKNVKDIEVYTQAIKKDGKVIAIVSSFIEWTEWRNGIMPWIYDVRVNESIDSKDYPSLLKVIVTLAYRAMDSPETSFRVATLDMKRPELIDSLKEMGFEESHYAVFEKKL